MDNFNLSQSDAQVQAILNKIQPLATTGDMATLGFGYGALPLVQQQPRRYQ